MPYFQKYLFQKKQKTHVTAINMIKNKNEAKKMTEHISDDYCKRKFNSTTCNSNQKQNNKAYQCECKNYRKCKKDYGWNPSTCICENSKYLKCIADTSVTECDEIKLVINNVPTKKTNTIVTKRENTISKNVTSTASINCYSKIERDFYILHTVLKVIILLLIITIICYHYAKQISIIQNEK